MCENCTMGYHECECPEDVRKWIDKPDVNGDTETREEPTNETCEEESNNGDD
jgi:hypothetical protein